MLALVGSLAVAAVPAAHADDIDVKKHHVDQEVSAAQRSLEGADAAVTTAEQTLRRAHAALPAARKGLAAARAQQVTAEAAAERATADLAAANTALGGTQKKLALTQADYDTRKAQVAAVVGAAYEQGPVTTLDTVLSRGDSTSLLDRTALLQSVLGSSNQKVVDLANSRAAVVEQQQELSRREAAVAQHAGEARAALASKQQAVADAAKQEQQIVQLAADEANALYVAKTHAGAQRRMLAQLQAESDQVAIQLQARYAAQLGAPPGGRSGGTGSGSPPTTSVGRGGLLWPASGALVQRYGPNYDAFTGVSGFHPGIDIGAPYGAPIWAAKDGIVALMQSTGQSGGYGNYTCIDHGGGFSTCYAHQSAFEVSLGQSVRQGQEIGKVGSTGYSTGAHLHFETRINGQTTDPMQFF